MHLGRLEQTQTQSHQLAQTLLLFEKNKKLTDLDR